MLGKPKVVNDTENKNQTFLRRYCVVLYCVVKEHIRFLFTVLWK